MSGKIDAHSYSIILLEYRKENDYEHSIVLQSSIFHFDIAINYNIVYINKFLPKPVKVKPIQFM